MASFIWQTKNVDHIATHGVLPEEAEYVVAHSRRPYPEYLGDGKFRVRGQTVVGRYLQVIYIFAVNARDIEWSDVDLTRCDPHDADLFYVVHAMELPAGEKRLYRRRIR